MQLAKDTARKIVTELLDKSNNLFKQELVGANEDSLDRAVRQFKSRIARISWKSSQKWCKWNDEGPVLMPDFTRIYYRKGDTEILVQEYPPQLRLLKFSGALAKRKNTSETMSDADASAVHHYTLALPYVVFIFKFTEGAFQEVHCAFSDRPLKRLEEIPMRPYLPNINNPSMNVCLGAGFPSKVLEKGNIVQQAAFVLDYFWHSSYTDEWAYHFWTNKKHFEETDERLSTLDNWQEASIENPLFVIEDVNWLKVSDDNFGDLIVQMLEADKADSSFHEELYHEIIDSFLTEIKKTMIENLSLTQDSHVSTIVDKLADQLTVALS